MTLVKFKHHPAQQSFNNFVDHFFNGFPSLLRDELNVPAVKHFAPVNVKEVENGYELEVAAPGFSKEDIKVDLDKNLLTISAERKEEEAKEGKHIRQEFRYQSFKRTFTVDKNIDTEKIEAKYNNGILTVNLPRKVEVKEPVKTISVQ